MKGTFLVEQFKVHDFDATWCCVHQTETLEEALAFAEKLHKRLVNRRVTLRDHEESSDVRIVQLHKIFEV